ncbi:MAG: nucleoside-diphosphate kinase [Solirubrobacteraceae bacterium]|nr:nucleoside-diphosphate kinase [Patulibacter sp.]
MTSADLTTPADEALATITGDHGLPVPASLTRDPRKQVLFGADPYFRQGWADALRILGPTAAEQLRDIGLVLLKPDAIAIGHADAAIDWMATKDAEIVLARRGTLSPHGIRAMWQFQMNAASIDRLELTDLALADAPGLILIGRLPADPVPATVRFSAWKGPADPRKREPGDLRNALGGGNFLLSFVHAADEPADLVRELAILFGAVEREAVLRQLADPTSIEGPDEARRMARAIEADLDPHDLELGTAIAALDASTPDGPHARAFRELLDAVRSGEFTDWRALWRAADDAGVPPTRWDRAVIGTYLMQHTEPGVSQILGSAARNLWQEDVQ